MSTKEFAVDLFNSLSEDELELFVKLFKDKNAIARIESEMLANDPNAKRYNSFDEIMKELEDEE